MARETQTDLISRHKKGLCFLDKEKMISIFVILITADYTKKEEKKKKTKEWDSRSDGKEFDMQNLFLSRHGQEPPERG